MTKRQHPTNTAERAQAAFDALRAAPSLETIKAYGDAWRAEYNEDTIEVSKHLIDALIAAMKSPHALTEVWNVALKIRGEYHEPASYFRHLMPADFAPIGEKVAADLGLPVPDVLLELAQRCNENLTLNVYVGRLLAKSGH
jgi:hypothetical protein